MVGIKLGVLVGATMELLEPHVASHMEIGGLIGMSIVLSIHPLLHHAALQDVWCCDTFRIVILELRLAEERRIGALEPAFRQHDAEVVGACTTCGFLRHAEARNIDKVNPHGVYFFTTVKSQDIGIVGLIVAVKVNRGNRVGLAHICVQVAIKMIIAHKHHGIIINSLTTW